MKQEGVDRSIQKGVGGWDRVMNLRKGKGGFIENDMSSNKDFTTRDVIAFVSTMIRGISEKNTRCGSGLKFVNCGGGK